MRSAGLIKSSVVLQAMNRVDRANYVPASSSRDAYTDAPQSIGFGATISAPHMHAHAAEALLPYLQPGSRVLDVGSGSGYTMAIFWHLVKPQPQAQAQGEQGLVVGMDHIPQLAQMADTNLRKDGLSEVLDRGLVQVVAGDGRLGEQGRQARRPDTHPTPAPSSCPGYPAGGPYSAIHVGAAAPTVPDTLVEQLARPGRMFIPVEDPSGRGQ